METLDKLVQLGLVRREAYGEIPPRVEYSLTVEGDDVRKAIIPYYYGLQRETLLGF